MGNQNNKSNRNKIKPKKKEKKDKTYKSNTTKNLKIKNPIFKKIQSLSNDICISFEIYQLKSKNNSIYIAFISESRCIIFYKYEDKSKMFKEIYSLEINTEYLFPQIESKYFYNPLNNKEYIFVLRSNEEIIEVYLIEDENKFKKINLEYKGIHRKGFNKNLSTDSFEVFYNEYDKNVYIIISYIIYEYGCFSDEPLDIYKYIDIIVLKKKKLELIKTVTFDLKNDGEVLHLIYKNENNKKNYIIIILNNNIQIIEITNKFKVENLLEINDKLNDFLKLVKIDYRFNNNVEIKFTCHPCLINKGINNDYLYIANNKKNKESDLVIIDLFKRKSFKFINLTFLVRSLVNWNNNNIIFISLDSFYIFDINTHQIVTKYINIDNGKTILNAKPFFSKEHEFNCLFLLINQL